MTELLLTEWKNRRELSNIILDILQEVKKPILSKELVQILKSRQINVPKRLVNSVLFSEAKRYVRYDRKTYKYTLKYVEANELDSTLENNILNTQKNHNLDHSNFEPQVINTLISSSHRFEFSVEDSTSPEFFNVKSSGSAISINLNKSHPFFIEIEKYLDSSKYPEVSIFLELIIGSWAMNEDSIPHLRKQTAQEFRSDWGRVLRKMIREGFFDQ